MKYRTEYEDYKLLQTWLIIIVSVLGIVFPYKCADLQCVRCVELSSVALQSH